MIDKNIGYGYNDLCIVPAVESNVESRSECDPFYSNGNLPIFASPMSSVVNIANFNLWESNNIIPVLPRNINYNIRLDYLKQNKWVALSLTEFEELFVNDDSFMSNASRTVKVCVDLANGHMQKLINLCKIAKNKYRDNLIIMTGNIANPETYKEYCDAGIDYVRCSIGSGSCCTTASNTAVHYPIATLIDEINYIKNSRKHTYEHYYDKFCTKVIADGGIRNYNDVIKALALGADYVMVGGLFSSFIESAGELQFKNINDYTIEMPELNILSYNEEDKREFIKKYNPQKVVYGMSTKQAQRLIKSEAEMKTAEGIERVVDVKYTIKQWIENMEAYLRSAMSYCNAKTLNDFIGKQILKVQSSGEVYSVNK